MRNTIAAMVLFVAAGPVSADVSVVIQDPNTAVATVTLPSAASPTYSAAVTIRFDAATNLSADALNVTAQLVDPATFAGLPLGVNLDSNFPVLISVEPPVAIFRNGVESNQTGDGNLSFLNTYELEIHSDEHLACSSPTSSYRLYKAPHGSNTFADVTDDLYAGSVRARGRGGAFSEFIIVADSRLQLLVAIDKTLALVARTVQAGIVGPLLILVNSILTDLLPIPNIPAAIAAVTQFINDVTAAAGITIANEWTAGGALVNDAGDLLSLAQTLLFTLNGLDGTAVCGPPPN